MKKFVGYRNNLFYFIITVGVLIFDQITKVVVSQSLQETMSHTIIDNLFYITYAKNFGAAWSMLEGKTGLFILIAFVAAIGMVIYFFKTREDQLITRVGLALAFSGLLGNVIDRIIFGYVRDFIDFIILGYDFPIFNIADMALVIGFGLLIIETIIEEVRNGKN